VQDYPDFHPPPVLSLPEQSSGFGESAVPFRNPTPNLPLRRFSVLTHDTSHQPIALFFLFQS
jgi:hypothetical protein